MSQDRRREFTEQDAKARLRYVAEHSETPAERANAEETLREQGFDPETGLPLD